MKMEFKLIPISRAKYNTQLLVDKYKKRMKKTLKRNYDNYVELKSDELEIAYYKRKGINIKPNIKGVK